MTVYYAPFRLCEVNFATQEPGEKAEMKEQKDPFNPYAQDKVFIKPPSDDIYEEPYMPQPMSTGTKAILVILLMGISIPAIGIAFVFIGFGSYSHSMEVSSQGYKKSDELADSVEAKNYSNVDHVFGNYEGERTGVEIYFHVGTPINTVAGQLVQIQEEYPDIESYSVVIDDKTYKTHQHIPGNQEEWKSVLSLVEEVHGGTFETAKNNINELIISVSVDSEPATFDEAQKALMDIAAHSDIPTGYGRLSVTAESADYETSTDNQELHFRLAVPAYSSSQTHNVLEELHSWSDSSYAPSDVVIDQSGSIMKVSVYGDFESEDDAARQVIANQVAHQIEKNLDGSRYEVTVSNGISDSNVQEYAHLSN